MTLSERSHVARSVYIHVPFCRHRCGYCNFTLVAGRDHLIKDYLRAIEMEFASVNGRPQVDTIYLGGGTPSRLPNTALQELLRLIDRHFDFDPQGEFTIEANPDDLPGEISATLSTGPVNRVSLGIQSFDPAKLISLDRDHTPDQINDAVLATRDIVDQFSIDLIFAAPDETRENWVKDLEAGIATGADHISTYELTYDKGTRFWNRLHHGQLVELDQQLCAEFYETTIDRLTTAGFQHYEVSSFAQKGHRSRHNQVYWSGQDYYAFGPGASGLLDGRRTTNHRSVSRYLKKVLAGDSAVEESEELSPTELALEQIVFGLRMIEGIDLVQFSMETGLQLSQVVATETLETLARQCLIEWSNQRLKLTHRGLLLGDYVCSTILTRT